ncbi:MAG TPA: PH domain-containing protein [Candidatus Saccharimonadales bacterium]|nr:PH domain-containing protein [Candidatus Saccharimonadales bacterium]
MNPDNPIPAPERIHNPLQVMQPGEQNICEVKRHPIGMLGTYFVGGLVIVALAVLLLVILPSAITTSSKSAVTTFGMIVFLLVTCLVVIFVFIANKVYWGNRWVVSSDSVTQISQTSLFHKQSSQLSLGNLEDVTSDQRGILAQMFGYGTLRVETAGERSKFTFPFCPNPNYYAQKILAAREAFEQAHHGGKQQPFSAPPQSPEQASQYQSHPQVPPVAPPAPVFPDTSHNPSDDQTA